MADIFVCADAIFGATTIRQVTQSSHATNQEIRKAMISGGATISQISGKSSGEISQLTSADIAALVALNTSAFVNSGLPLLASTITIPYKLRSNGAFFQGATSHPALTGANALIVPTSVDVTQDGDMALMQMDIHWISTNGIAKGCDDSTGLSLAAQSFNAEYTLGPCYINGSLIEGVQGFRVTPGIEVVKPPLGAGSVFPTHISIKNVMPTMQLTVNDFDAIEATVGDFTVMTSANFYLKKRADSGVFTAGATTEHIRFTFAAGLTDTDNVSVSNNDDGSATITLHGKTLTAAATVALP